MRRIAIGKEKRLDSALITQHNQRSAVQFAVENALINSKAYEKRNGQGPCNLLWRRITRSSAIVISIHTCLRILNNTLAGGGFGLSIQTEVADREGEARSWHKILLPAENKLESLWFCANYIKFGT